MLDEKMKKYLLPLLSLSLLILVGCSFNWRFWEKDAAGTDWRSEIAIGQECGIEGMSCCKDREPACNEGSCCSDPSDPARQLCLKDCNCGTKNNFCCKDEPKCADKLGCSRQSLCVPCGDSDQPCCAKGLCGRNDLLCRDQYCIECGKTGNPCCSQDLCENQNETDNTKAECQNNTCVLCGSDEKVFCIKGGQCLPGHMPNNGQCILCGGLDQPCCSKDSLNGYECKPDLKLKCELGFCTQIE